MNYEQTVRTVSWLMVVSIVFITVACQPVRSVTPEPVTDTSLAGSSVDSAQRILEQGIALIEEGEFEQAIVALDETIRIDPENVESYYNRGLAYSKLGEMELTNLDFDQAYEDYELAIQNYDKATQLDPEFTDTYFNRGLAYLKTDRYKQAIQDFDDTLLLDLEYVDAYCFRGMAYVMINDSDKAISDLELFLELAPNSPFAVDAESLLQYLIDAE